MDQMSDLQVSFNELSAETPREEIDLLVSEGMKLFEPIIASFDFSNWDEELDTPTMMLFDEIAYRGLNEAQAYAQDRIMELLMMRIREYANRLTPT